MQRRKRLALAFSFVVCWLASSFGLAQDYVSQLKGATNFEQARAAVDAAKAAGYGGDEYLSNPLKRADQDRVAASLELWQDTGKVPTSGDQSKTIARIKDGAYYDSQARQDSNWLNNVWKRFPKWNLEKPDINAPRITPPSIGPFPIYLLYTIIAVVFLGAIYFIAKLFLENRKMQRKASAILEEEEPERTLDEWLQIAEQLEQEGEYRKAVRALYVACLLKLDEAGVARFIRTQTNWEHLARIESSLQKPASLNMRTPTKEFDVIWYGYNCKGASDVAKFREYYIGLKDMVAKAAA